MNFNVVFKPEADADFGNLPPMVASLLLVEIDRLAADPEGLRSPWHFPYRPVEWIFKTSFEVEGLCWVFRVGFEYDAHDPLTLNLLYIAAQSLPPNSPTV